MLRPRHGHHIQTAEMADATSSNPAMPRRAARMSPYLVGNIIRLQDVSYRHRR